VRLRCARRSRSGSGADEHGLLAWARSGYWIDTHGELHKRKGGGRPPPSSSELLQQFQDKLLLLVGLGQRGDARLFQDRVLGHVSDRGRDVGGDNAVLG